MRIHPKEDVMLEFFQSQSHQEWDCTCHGCLLLTDGEPRCLEQRGDNWLKSCTLWPRRNEFWTGA